jgi:hypothetical protein
MDLVFVDYTLDDLLYFILFQLCNFVDGTALVAMLLDDFDILEIVDMRNDDVFLEMRHFHL